MSKLFRLTKKRWMFGLMAVLMLSISFTSYATEATKEKLEQAKEKKEETQGQLSETQEDIQNLTSTQLSLTGTLANLNNQLSIVSDNLAVLEQDIATKQSEISDTNDRIAVKMQEVSDAKDRVANQYDLMKKQLKFMYERGDNLYMELLFSAGSFANMLNHTSYIEQLSAYQKNMLESFREAQRELEEKQAQLEAELAVLEGEEQELSDYQTEVKTEQSKISGMVNDTSANINMTATQIKAAEAEADALKVQIEQQNAEIAALEKQLAEEERMIALAKASSWRDISQVEFAEGDRYLLASLIYCEAGGEPYEGQLAVGSVVINRLLSSVYPNTVVGVIYQNKQFSPVLDGHLAIALANGKATASCYQAADAAMSGTTNVSNCLYFRTPIPQVTPRYTIGHHVFY